MALMNEKVTEVWSACSEQASQLFQEPVIWIHPISSVKYATKKLVDKMLSK